MADVDLSGVLERLDTIISDMEKSDTYDQQQIDQLNSISSDLEEVNSNLIVVKDQVLILSDTVSSGVSDDVAFHGVLSLILGVLLGVLIILGWCRL